MLQHLPRFPISVYKQHAQQPSLTKQRRAGPPLGFQNLGILLITHRGALSEGRFSPPSPVSSASSRFPVRPRSPSSGARGLLTKHFCRASQLWRRPSQPQRPEQKEQSTRNAARRRQPPPRQALPFLSLPFLPRLLHPLSAAPPPFCERGGRGPRAHL